MCSIKLGNTLIGGLNNAVYIIAEIGQNHQGCLDIAKEMILKAKQIGCNCVKFQKSCLDAKFTKSALNRKYDGINSWGITYGEHKAYLEFSLEQYRELQEFSRKEKIDFTASAMDEISLVQLNEMNVPFIKIGSGDANNFPMLKKAAQMQCPFVISTGMQTMQTVDQIVKIMKAAGKTNFALLHCVSSYPTEPKNCQLQQLFGLQQKYPNVVCGYSGHEEGIEITKAAVLLGAKIVERHFTLDKAQKGSDHQCSLNLEEFQRLVENVRVFEKNGLLKNIPLNVNHIKDILGTNPTEVDMALVEVADKTILPCEWSCKNKLGKSIVTSKSLKRGHILQQQDVYIKVSEPNGIPAENYADVLGMKLTCDLKYDNAIQYNNLK